MFDCLSYGQVCVYMPEPSCTPSETFIGFRMALSTGVLKMSEISLNFMSANPDYLIETSCYRDEIRLLAQMRNGDTYLVQMETLMRANTNLAIHGGMIDGIRNAEFARGLIIVDRLDPAILMPVVSSAASEGFFNSQRSIRQLPISFNGLKMYDSESGAFHSPPLSADMLSEMETYRRAEPTKVIQMIEALDYHGHQLKRRIVTFTAPNGVQTDLTLATTQSVEHYFEALRAQPQRDHPIFLAIPGLILVKNNLESNIDKALAHCQESMFLMTLNSYG
jgi:hypothetical protein